MRAIETPYTLLENFNEYLEYFSVLIEYWMVCVCVCVC